MEHRYKKSIFTYLHGNGPYNGDDAPRLWVDGRSKGQIIQGPNSAVVKFKKSLCAKCNNERTQRADRAHHRWAKFVLDNSPAMVAQGWVDLAAAGFSADDIDHLLRALGKQLGCKIREAPGEYDVPMSLRLLVFLGWEVIQGIDVVLVRNPISLPTMLGYGPLYRMPEGQELGFWCTYDLGYISILVAIGLTSKLRALERVVPGVERVRVYETTDLPVRLGEGLGIGKKA